MFHFQILPGRGSLHEELPMVIWKFPFKCCHTHQNESKASTTCPAVGLIPSHEADIDKLPTHIETVWPWELPEESHLPTVRWAIGGWQFCQFSSHHPILIWFSHLAYPSVNKHVAKFPWLKPVRSFNYPPKIHHFEWRIQNSIPIRSNEIAGFCRCFGEILWFQGFAMVNFPKVGIEAERNPEKHGDIMGKSPFMGIQTWATHIGIIRILCFTG